MASKKKRPKFILSVVYCLLFVVLVLVFSYWWQRQTIPIDTEVKETMVFIVPEGWGVSQVAESLKKRGLIKNEYVFKLLVLKEGLSKKIQAGNFYLSSSMTTFEVLQQLTHGTVDVWITIQEGLRREEIAVIINKALTSAAGEFDKDEFILKTKNKKGFLFPDTYLISKDSSVDKIIEILQENFEKKYSSLKNQTLLSREQLVILASLIEREARHEKDRFIVAGILLKRLRNDWPLQVDATVQYAIASKNCQQGKDDCDYWLQPSGEDLKIKSPYNTYKKKGLPPTPICNSGLSSLKAAVQPQETDYWYYLSEPSGRIHYAKTLEEHESNISKYLSK